jgi:hypothetical protein
MPERRRCIPDVRSLAASRYLLDKSTGSLFSCFASARRKKVLSGGTHQYYLVGIVFQDLPCHVQAIQFWPPNAQNKKNLPAVNK